MPTTYARVGHSAYPPVVDLVVSVNGGLPILARASDGQLVVGRDVPPAHIHVDHPGISRLHLRLLPRGAAWDLVDYGSVNGVYLDGQRLECDIPIVAGMVVYLGAPDGIPVAFDYVEASTAPELTAPAPVGPSSPKADTPCPQLQPAANIPTADDDAGGDDPDNDDETTEVITPQMRAALLVDVATLTLAGIAAALVELTPDSTRSGGTVLVADVRDRLSQLRNTLSALRSTPAGVEVAELLDVIAGIYSRQLGTDAA